ncbi:unnamed protein product [Clonostachys solani]|uniref:Uncharacterized protein n=1 Tax=Clonostachys solani TaxID=160281 RepID=A0A9N9W968_9HYPO|nr:unnamed protein product [Clonostachys solani]
MLDDNNGARYWPDNYPNSEDSTNANKLTHSKDEPNLTAGLPIGITVQGRKSGRQDHELFEILRYLRGIGAAPAPREAPGPENGADFTSFTFAAKEEDTGAPGISSVPPFAANGIEQGSSVQQDSTPGQVRPLRPQENNADMNQDGQFDGATLNNATDNISPPNPNPGPRRTDGREASRNIPRRGNVTRRYMPPRNRRRPRKDGYASERILEEYMGSSASSESDSDSDTQSEQMNNGTENIEEGPSEPTNVANKQLEFQTSDDAHMNEAESSNEAHSDVDPNAVPLPQLHYHYFLLLDRGTGVDHVPWEPGRRLTELTWAQLERSLPVQLLMASDILLVRVFGFKQIKGRQEEFRQDDMGFDMSMRRLNSKVEGIQNAYSDLARIDLRTEIEAGKHFMRGPPLAEREPEANWF